MAGSSSSKIATLIVIVPLLAVAWFLAPLALPVWRWQNMDFLQLAKKTGMKEGELKREFDMRVRYQPRGAGDKDPTPYQIISMDPPWASVDDKNNDEDHLLVRCTFISDRSGNPPSTLFLGSTFKDRYFKVHGWRFPPGTFGFNKTRPVVVYQGDSIEKMSIAEADVIHNEIGLGQVKWANDDTDIDDGFRP
jgi:hypothetical protein